MLFDKNRLRSRVLLLWGCLLFTFFAAAQPIKVACVGNSVTFGYGLKNPSIAAYPVILQSLLTKKYQVQNFGLSGATLLKKGHRPYFRSKEFTQAIAFSPDIVIIHLGLNDTDPRNWPNYKTDFEPDYSWLISQFREKNPKVKVYICRLTPIFDGHPRFKSSTRDWYTQIQQLIPGIALANNTGLIDLHTPLSSRPDLFADDLHPNEEGAEIIAKTIYSALTGDYGNLKLASIFSDHMIIQRNKPIVIYGTANRDDQITVSFGQEKRLVKPKQGYWKAVFAARAAGGPYSLRISTTAQTINIQDILIGDVWLCSGQSNMVFPVNASAGAASALNDLKANTPLRILNFKPIADTNDQSWNEATLRKVNQLAYFNGQWERAGKQNLADFSAVAYYFGEEVQQKTHVPIGLIQLAVGGSTVESWINRSTMEHDEQLVDVLSNWRKSDFVQEWVRGRADVNLKNAENPKQRHPYEPTYNYEAGIVKLTDFPIRGVIWYQGESNAQNPEQYAHAFPTLVKSWRSKWGYDFPFYYVQLSGINRPDWPAFREMQFSIQTQIPHSGMAVSYDLGDSTNVHPVRKKQIGKRLALLALNKTYGNPEIISSGPIPISVRKEKGRFIVRFQNARNLHTRNGEAVKGFELINQKGMRFDAKGRVSGTHVELAIPAKQHFKKILYAWQAFSDANLLNEANLPASTFSLTLKY